jgi:hypothetical protein
MNGPTPTIWDILMVVAWNWPTVRTKPVSPADGAFWLVVIASLLLV